MPSKSIIICSTGRSGSTLLGRTLSSVGYAGNCREFFRPDVLANHGVGKSVDRLYGYFASAYGRGKTSNQVFGVKLHWDHMVDLLKIVRTDPTWQPQSDISVLSELFPNPTFIFIRRQHLVKQAISMEMGNQTGVYVIDAENAGDRPSVEQRLRFKPLNIYRCKQGIQRRNQKWRDFFQQNNVSFLEVVYEDLVQDFDTVMGRVLEFSGFGVCAAEINIIQATKKQGNRVNERWLKYYQLIPEGLLAYYSNLRQSVQKVLN